MKFRTRVVWVAAAAFVLVGCSQELQHNLTEQDANDILVLLSENNINTAEKLPEPGGNEPTYMVKVGRADYRAAAKLLTQYSLPRPKAAGLEIFRQNKGMIPTQTEERAMLIEALGGEVSKSLQKVDGVLEAHTIVNMPEVNDLTQPDKKPTPTASVLVKYRASIEGKPPLEEAALRKFVASALPDMKPENVTVILAQAQLPTAEVGADQREQDVLGFRMNAASAQQFRMAVGVTALVVLLLAAFSAWNFLRGGSSQPQRPRMPRKPPEG